MKTAPMVRYIGFGLALMLCAVSAHAESGVGFDVRLSGDKQRAAEVLKAVRAWEDAYARNDINGILSLWDPEAEMNVQALPQAISFKQLERSYRQESATAKPGRPVWVGIIDEVFADGNVAFVRGIAEQRQTKPDGTIEIGERNRCIDLLRRHSAGDWHIFRSMCYPVKNGLI